MATYIPVTNIPIQFVDASGVPLVGGSLEFYLAGTSTATDLFSDDAGTSIGTSIDLNALGYPESGGNLVFLFRDQSKALKIVLKDALAATVGTFDDIPAVASFDSASSAKLDFITVTQAVDLDQMETDIAAALGSTGGTITGDLTLGAGTFVNYSVTAGITASTTQTQGEGALVSGVNEVSTVANANDTVTLPAAVAGRQCIVINNGANTLQIFPASGDNINTGAVDASTTAATGDNILFIAINSTKWEAC
jgi:hypothetical protein